MIITFQVLGDIEIAQGIERDKEKKQKEVCVVTFPLDNDWSHDLVQQAGGEVKHPLDLNYELLKADLTLLDKKSSEFSLIEKYLRGTEPQYRKLEIMDVWKVDRHAVVCVCTCYVMSFIEIWPTQFVCRMTSSNNMILLTTAVSFGMAPMWL